MAMQEWSLITSLLVDTPVSDEVELEFPQKECRGHNCVESGREKPLIDHFLVMPLAFTAVLECVGSSSIG